MKEFNPFPEAQADRQKIGYGDAKSQALMGESSGPADSASELAFAVHEANQHLDQAHTAKLGREAITALGVGPVRIDATPVSLLTHPTSETTPEHVNPSPLMLPEVGTPDQPRTLTNA